MDFVSGHKQINLIRVSAFRVIFQRALVFLSKVTQGAPETTLKRIRPARLCSTFSSVNIKSIIVSFFIYFIDLNFNFNATDFSATSL